MPKYPVQGNLVLNAMDTTFSPNMCYMSLNEILQMRESPVTEEQAWALCYQLCALLIRDHLNKLKPNMDSPQTPSLEGVDAVLLANDGGVCLKDAFAVGREEQVLDQLGRLIYYCLDWGLGDDVERELEDTLTSLVCRMINVSVGDDEPYPPFHSLSEALQVCVDRLDDPEHVDQHYKHVCAGLFKSCTRRLQDFLEPEAPLTSQCQTEVPSWSSVIMELQQGYTLRPCDSWLQLKPRFLPNEHFPFDQLRQDIESKRFSRCMNQIELKAPPRKTLDPFETLLETIRSRPKLKPVSDRKLREKPYEQPCLHEQLMMEIRTVNPQQLFASCKKRRTPCTMGPTAPHRSDDGPALTSPEKTPSGQQLLKQHTRTKTSIGCMSPIPRSRLVDLKESYRKRRAQSVGAFSELRQSKKARCSDQDPLTIARVMTPQQTDSDTKSKVVCESSPAHWQVCKCCFKRSLFFTWSNVCSRCNRVMCPDCGVKMLVPYKWCMELPVTFFRRIVLQPATHEALSPFWKVRLSWDRTKVPVVLESLALGSWSQHSLAMRGWHSQEVCVQCQALLEAALDTADTGGGSRDVF